MVVLVKEPGKNVYKKEIDGSLESLQSLVDGFIELIPCNVLNEKNIAMVGNEEARILDLEENLIILNKKKEQVGDVKGDIIYLGVGYDCEFTGLTEEQISYLHEKIFDNPLKAIRTDGLIIDSLML